MMSLELLFPVHFLYTRVGLHAAGAGLVFRDGESKAALGVESHGKCFGGNILFHVFSALVMVTW